MFKGLDGLKKRQRQGGKREVYGKDSNGRRGFKSGRSLDGLSLSLRVVGK